MAPPEGGALPTHEGADSTTLPVEACSDLSASSERIPEHISEQISERIPSGGSSSASSASASALACW